MAVRNDSNSRVQVPIPKNSPLMHVAGVSYERGVVVHRMMGRVSVLAGLAHTILVVFDWERYYQERGYHLFQRTLEESAPRCPYDPVIAWPWDKATGEWLPGLPRSEPRLGGWGVPAGASSAIQEAAK